MAGKVEDLDAKAFAPEQFWLQGREVYVWCPDGLREAKLGNAFWEKKLGVVASGRNWNTVRKLAELAGSS